MRASLDTARRLLFERRAFFSGIRLLSPSVHA